MKFPLLVSGFLILAGGLSGWWFWPRREGGVSGGHGDRLIPPAMAAVLPPECRQVVLVLAHNRDRPSARVWLLERTGARARMPWGYNDKWKIKAGPLEAVIGRNGAAWGEGQPRLVNPGGFPDKVEGDGRSPAGVFALPWAFGVKPAAEMTGLKLPWRECTETLRGVYDVKSRYYNQVVDEAVIPRRDWSSAEIMRRADGLYDEGVAIAHNPANRPGAGSCIFLHIRQGPGVGTSGCTALSREDMRLILRWLDPAESPRLVLDVEKAGTQRQ
ncbi:MAG: hypothetical protein EOP86_01255 [Verrucomicrobiaceae bacterium]|nr:MAG: hypothetical protein EOP86_01255 [Verrucomicrobiaceae bacterium]